MTLSVSLDLHTQAKPHTRRACAMPDLPHGRAFFQHPPRAPRWQYRERPSHTDAPALPRSGMAHAHLSAFATHNLSADGALPGQAGRGTKA